mgnify:CR=1 FL=1
MLEAARSVEWIVVDDDGTRRSPPMAGSLAEAAPQVQGRPVIVLVPATETLTTVVNLPIRGAARLLAALPYALEEQVAALRGAAAVVDRRRRRLLRR